MRKIIVFSLLLLTGTFIYGQSDKTIKSLGIVTKETVRHTDTKNSYTESVEKFDENGNLIEEIEYSQDKTIKKHRQWTYNENNDKTSELELDANGKIISKIIYEYDGKLKISKKEYNEKGKLISWKSYSYFTKTGKLTGE